MNAYGIGSFVITICFSTALANQEELAITSRLEAHLEEISHLLRAELDNRVMALRRMAKRWESERDTSKELWEQDASQHYQDLSGFQALEWVDNRGVIRWIYPTKGNEEALNFDLKLKPDRASAMEKARQTKTVVMTHAVELVQGGLGFLLFAPIFFDNSSQGFMLWVFRFQALLDVTFERLPPDVAISVKENGKELYRFAHFSEPSETEQPIKASTDFYYSGVSWKLSVTPSAKFLAEERGGLALAGLIVGSIFSVLLALSMTLYQVAGRRAVSLLAENRERQLAEEELGRSNSELDRFAYVASHDLKAPLRAIGNYAEWIEEDAVKQLPEKSKEHLLKLRQRVVRMEALLDDLLAYSRVGRKEEELVEIKTEILISDVVEFLSPPQEFRVEIQGKLPIVRSQKTLLELVFRNLIGNAIKHHHRKDGCIRVSATEIGAVYEFVVTDDGPGIAPRYHEKIFQMFQRLKSSDQVEGTGMGLALVKRVVESQGGKIELRSDEGEGASFHFTWPKNAGRVNQDKNQDKVEYA